MPKEVVLEQYKREREYKHKKKENVKSIPSAGGVSHSHTLQQCPGTSTNCGERHTSVSLGGGRFSCGHNVEQACLPFYYYSMLRFYPRMLKYFLCIPVTK